MLKQSALLKISAGINHPWIGMMIASFLQNPLIIHFPQTSGEETEITLWQLFFVLLAIIPVSKMFSMIFMNFLARIGTVDEDVWAAKGLGIMVASSL